MNRMGVNVSMTSIARRSLCFLLIGALLLFVASPVMAGSQKLTGFKIARKGHDSEVLTMTFSGRAPHPDFISIDKPAQLTLELNGVQKDTSNADRHLNHGLVRSVHTGSVQGGMRLDIKMRHSVPFHVHHSGHRIRIFLNIKPGQSKSVSKAKHAQSNSTQERHTGAHHRHVTHVNFQSRQHREGQVIVQLSSPHAPVSTRRKGNKVLVNIRNTGLPHHLQQHLDVSSFNSIVQGINVSHQNDNVHLVIKPRHGVHKFTQLAYETGNTVKIELTPKALPHQGQHNSNKPHYTGQKITLSFENIKVRKLLQIIASTANVNLVTSGKVKGSMSLRLQHVPWDQALHIILRSQGLGKNKNGDVMTIAPLSQMAARDKAQKAAQKATRNLHSIHNKIISLNYAKAANIKKLIKGAKGGTNGSLLSKRGHIQVDKRTNSLVISATQAHIHAIQKLVKKLDKAQKQVQVQARIVVANRKFERKLGSQLHFRAANQSSGTGPTGNGLTSSSSASSSSGSNPNQITTGGFSTRMPVSSATSQIATSIITGNMNIGLVLQALQSENHGKVVSSPRVITANDQKASVSRGTQIPYIRSTSGSLSGSRVSFKKAQLKLTVTPRITPNHHVLMNLNIENDSIGQNVPTASGHSAPAINTNKLKTHVLVNNGNTVVLGGIFKHTHTRKKSGVPGFDRLPLLGRLFQMTNRINHRRQLLIFITPKILNSQVQATGHQ